MWFAHRLITYNFFSNYMFLSDKTHYKHVSIINDKYMVYKTCLKRKFLCYHLNTRDKIIKIIQFNSNVVKVLIITFLVVCFLHSGKGYRFLSLKYSLSRVICRKRFSMLSRSQYESWIGTYLVSYNIQRRNKETETKNVLSWRNPKGVTFVQMVVDIFIDIDNIYYFVRKVMKK